MPYHPAPIAKPEVRHTVDPNRLPSDRHRDLLEQQALLLDAAPVQMWVLADSGTYGRVNRRHADFVGRRPEELLDRTAGCWDRPRQHAGLRQVADVRQHPHGELRSSYDAGPGDHQQRPSGGEAAEHRAPPCRRHDRIRRSIGRRPIRIISR